MTITREPKMTVQKVLGANWDATATDYDGTPSIHTGRYERGNSAVPSIALFDFNESPADGGQTGYHAIDAASGRGSQLITGRGTAQIVAGSWDDLKGEGANGSNINPKKLSWDMYDHARNLLIDNQQAGGLRFLSPERVREQVAYYDDPNADADGEVAVMMRELRVKFGYLVD